jgi:hypothetical protein
MLGKRAIQGRIKLSAPPGDELQARSVRGNLRCLFICSGDRSLWLDADPPARSSCFPSTNNQALIALSTANAAPSSETRRKALTLVGMVMPASLVCCALISCCTPEERCRVARWLSRLLVKTARATSGAVHRSVNRKAKVVSQGGPATSISWGSSRRPTWETRRTHRLTSSLPRNSPAHEFFPGNTNLMSSA